MQSIFSNALSRAVAKHIGLSGTRQETLSWLTLLIMQHGTISLWRLAAYVASVAQTASVQRRFYRFFQFVLIELAQRGDVLGGDNARLVCDLSCHLIPAKSLPTWAFEVPINIGFRRGPYRRKCPNSSDFLSVFGPNLKRA